MMFREISVIDRRIASNDGCLKKNVAHIDVRLDIHLLYVTPMHCMAIPVEMTWLCRLERQITMSAFTTTWFHQFLIYNDNVNFLVVTKSLHFTYFYLLRCTDSALKQITPNPLLVLVLLVAPESVRRGNSINSHKRNILHPAKIIKLVVFLLRTRESPLRFPWINKINV